MKTKALCIIAFLISIATYAQNGINYKVLIKDNNGNVIANSSVTLQLSILKGVGQTNVYTETHNPVTDNNGIVIVNIGEGTFVSGNYSTINWGSDTHYLKVQVDIGSGLVVMGITEFKAVPLALNVTGLEAIDEGNGIGWRLKGRDPDYYGNIGNGAVDLSYNDGLFSPSGATGSWSFASGLYTNAVATHSTAMGYLASATGGGSVALGIGTQASGQGAVAIGGNTDATGLYSTAMGNIATASGISSTAMGYQTIASGDYATAMGIGTKAQGYGTTAIGHYNDGGSYDPNASHPLNPLFEIGNGTSDFYRNNLLTIYESGAAHLVGHISVIDVSIDPNVHGIFAFKDLPFNSYVDNYGIYGRNDIDDYYGIGVGGKGGWIGVEGESLGSGSGTYYGVIGNSTGTNSGFNYGVYGQATGGSYNYSVYADGNLAYTGTLINASDRKLKQNINAITGSLDVISQLTPSSYYIKDSYQKSMTMSNQLQYGFIAQELQDVIPELVSLNMHPGETKEDASIKYLGVNYIGLIPIITAGIKEQQQIIMSQNETITNQSEQIMSLKKDLMDLTSRINRIEKTLND